MIENPITIAKRYTGRAALAGSLIFLGGVACDNNSHADSTPARQTAGITKTDQPGPVAEGLFNYFYPEFAKANLIATEDYFLDYDYVGSNTPGEVVNYTDFKVQMSVVNEIFRYFEFYKKTSAKKPFEMPGALGNQDQKIIITTRQQKLRSLIFIPNDAPLPHLEDPLTREKQPSGITFNKAGAGFSFVKTDAGKLAAFESVPENATLSAAVEICQQSLESKLVDSSGQTVPEDALQNSQEVICNSFGIAIASKLLGYTYEEYSDILHKLTVVNLPPIIINKTAYDSFASMGTVIK